MSSKAIYICFTLIFAFVLLGWRIASSDAYETAKYSVIESEKTYEIREYPDLMLAATKMRSESKRDNGSFMRLFRYISGANNNDQKVAMTTPVFMESDQENKEGQMGFVLPEKVAAERAPLPSSDQVEIKKREGGKFAVIRFNGRMDNDSVAKAEKSLRDWIKNRGLAAEENYESAGYDPPWTPGRFRRNEVLIRLLPQQQQAESKSSNQ